MRQRNGVSTVGVIGGLLVLLMVAAAGCDDSEPETTVGPTASPQTILRAAREATDMADSSGPLTCPR